MHDYTGHKSDVTTDGSGRATITIPSNATGFGFVCYSTYGVTGGFLPQWQTVTQEWAGAKDLDIRPADTTGSYPARVFAQAGKTISVELYYDVTGWTDATRITVTLLGTDSVTVVGQASMTKAGPQGLAFEVVPATSGNYLFRIQGVATPPSNAAPKYWLKVTYTGPRFFSPTLTTALKAAAGLGTATGPMAQFVGGPVDMTAVAGLMRMWNGM